MQRSESKQYAPHFVFKNVVQPPVFCSILIEFSVLHQFTRVQWLNTTLDEAWNFFSSPKNLPLITPPDLGFQVLSELPDRMYEGLFIRYSVRPLLGIPMEWVTEITKVEEGRFFVDEQRVGPYSIWHHEHHFESTDKGVRMLDRVSYVIPFGVLGDWVEPWLVKPRLEHIFAYREAQVEQRFGKAVR